MASLTRWMWVWVNSGNWWWTGRPELELQFMGSQRVRHDWATELHWMELNESPHKRLLPPYHVCTRTKSFSCFPLLATLWTAAWQAPLSLGFSRQQYWSGLPCPPPGDLPDPGIVATSLAGGVFTTGITCSTLTKGKDKTLKGSANQQVTHLDNGIKSNIL